VLLAELAVSVPAPVVVLEVESLELDELPLLLQDQINAADKQKAKERNFFFIKWFLCVDVQKFYASLFAIICFFKTIDNNASYKIKG
jgi:hypothetical protein